MGHLENVKISNLMAKMMKTVTNVIAMLVTKVSIVKTVSNVYVLHWYFTGTKNVFVVTLI